MASEKENTRQQFTFRREWYEIASCFDQSVRCEIYDMIMEKVFSGDVTFTYSAMATGAFKAISFQIDSDKKRLEEISEKRKEAGRIGGKANGSKTKQNEANGSKTSKCFFCFGSTATAAADHDQRKGFPKTHDR